MIQYSLRSLILVCLLSAIQCSVPWSTLTEAELSELPSNEFEQILALQLGSIPPQVSSSIRTANPSSQILEYKQHFASMFNSRIVYSNNYVWINGFLSN